MVSGSATGRLISKDAQPITAEDGKGTVYLAKLPEGYAPGSTLRIWAHCLTHGEYVDFVTF